MSLFVALTWLLPAVFLALCLFGPAQSLQTSGVAGTWVREIALTFRDAETQWMVYACLMVYLVTFLVLGKRQAEAVVGRVTRCAPSLWAGAPLSPARSPSDGERVSEGREGGFWLLRNPDLRLPSGRSSSISRGNRCMGCQPNY